MTFFAHSTSLLPSNDMPGPAETFALWCPHCILAVNISALDFLPFRKRSLFDTKTRERKVCDRSAKGHWRPCVQETGISILAHVASPVIHPALTWPLDDTRLLWILRLWCTGCGPPSWTEYICVIARLRMWLLFCFFALQAAQKIL